MRINYYFFGTMRIGRAQALIFGGTVMAALLFGLLAAEPAHAAATFTVDRNDDPDPSTANACTAAANDCSLRGAIVAANASAGADTITMPAGTYTLNRNGAGEDASSTGDLDVSGDLTITGAGARTTSVVGGAAPFDDRIFDVQPDATATIADLTITGGKLANDGPGGVQNQGDLTLEKVAITGNTAFGTGGVSSHGATSNLTLTDSTVSGNTASIDIGGIAVFQNGNATITNSTISGNHADRYGGGVVGGGGALVNILNSTIASNTSSRLGGGIITMGPGALVLVENTIVAGNTQNNCDTAQIPGGIISSQGHNLSSDSSCDFTEPGDKQGTNPRLGLLANNGGPTDTHALLRRSAALNAIPKGTNGCGTTVTTDQRGVTRPQGSGCDIGAFEKQKRR